MENTSAMESRLTRMDEKLDSIKEAVHELVTELRVEQRASMDRQKKVEDLESRVKQLEEWKWKMVGAATVIGVIAGGVGAALSKVVAGH